MRLRNSLHAFQLSQQLVCFTAQLLGFWTAGTFSFLFNPTPGFSGLWRKHSPSTLTRSCSGHGWACAWWRPVPLGDRIFLLDLLPYSQHFADLPPTNPNAAPILGKTPFDKVQIAVWTRLLRMLIWLASSRGPLKNWLKVELVFPFYIAGLLLLPWPQPCFHSWKGLVF